MKTLILLGIVAVQFGVSAQAGVTRTKNEGAQCAAQSQDYAVAEVKDAKKASTNAGTAK